MPSKSRGPWFEGACMYKEVHAPHAARWTTTATQPRARRSSTTRATSSRSTPTPGSPTRRAPPPPWLPGSQPCGLPCTGLPACPHVSPPSAPGGTLPAAPSNRSAHHGCGSAAMQETSRCILGLPKAPPQRDSQRQGNQCLRFTWQLQLCLTLHHWLAAQERQQLKERERAITEAEQARRKSVRVTFDLLGRQVRPSAGEPRPNDALLP